MAVEQVAGYDVNTMLLEILSSCRGREARHRHNSAVRRGGSSRHPRQRRAHLSAGSQDENIAVDSLQGVHHRFGWPTEPFFQFIVRHQVVFRVGESECCRERELYSRSHKVDGQTILWARSFQQAEDLSLFKLLPLDLDFCSSAVFFSAGWRIIDLQP